MRCKKHLPDLTSTVGVCASCLRERLQPILAAQDKALAQAQTQAQSGGDNINNRRRKSKSKSKPNLEPESEPEPEPNLPPPLNFPRSVPYVSHRKSDCGRRRERMFYSTPPVTAAVSDGGTKRRSGGRFWMLSNIFRPKSNRTESLSHCDEDASSSASWFSTIPHARRHENRRTACQRADQGGLSKNCVSTEETHDVTTDSGNSSESSPATKNTTAAGSGRSRLGVAGGKGITNMAFCLSPLVRANPNRHWSNKGLAHEHGGGGTHHMTNTASFCSNRSRKMADFGRVSHHR